MSYGFPLPSVSSVDAQHWEHVQEGIFTLHTCTQCGRSYLPGTVMCPNCRSVHLEWRATKGDGHVVSWVTFHKWYFSGPSGAPYDVIMVRLDEGPHILGSPAVGEAPTLRVGLPVSTVLERDSRGLVRPVFASKV